MSGYHGCYLRVDLTTGSSERIALSERLLRRTLGGSGLGVALLLREGAAEVEPLSPAAALAFVFSPLVGSPLTTSAKFAVVSKSPLTQRINDSLASSGFAIAGKKTGHDAIVLVGRAERPSILVIDDANVRLEPADLADGTGPDSSVGCYLQTAQGLGALHGRDIPTLAVETGQPPGAESVGSILVLCHHPSLVFNADLRPGVSRHDRVSVEAADGERTQKGKAQTKARKVWCET